MGTGSDFTDYMLIKLIVVGVLAFFAGLMGWKGPN